VEGTEFVSAYLLVRGDVVRVPGQEGWYVVTSAFQEGAGGPIDLDLYGERGEGGYGWHAGHQEPVERRIRPI